MEITQLLTPSWGSIEAWNRAFEKVEDYLRAHRVDSRLQRARLIEQVLSTVATRGPSRQTPDDDVIESLAIEECRNMMNAWFAGLRGDGMEPTRSFDSIDARIALLVSDAPIRWPYQFMTPGALPDDMRRQLQTLAIKAGPELAISHMVPRDIDIGFIPEFAGNTMATFARVPALKVVVAWVLYLAVLAILFYFTRSR